MLGFLIACAIFLLVCMLLNTMSSCSMMAQSIGSVVSGTTYPSDDPELVAVEADYAAKETALQAEIDNIEIATAGSYLAVFDTSTGSLAYFDEAMLTDLASPLQRV